MGLKGDVTPSLDHNSLQENIVRSQNIIENIIVCNNLLLNVCIKDILYKNKVVKFED